MLHIQSLNVALHIGAAAVEAASAFVVAAFDLSAFVGTLFQTVPLFLQQILQVQPASVVVHLAAVA